jgi:hypothetical protein
VVAIVEGLLRGIALLTLPGWVAVVASVSVAVPSIVLGTVLALRYLAALPLRGNHPPASGSRWHTIRQTKQESES